MGPGQIGEAVVEGEDATGRGAAAAWDMAAGEVLGEVLGDG